MSHYIVHHLFHFLTCLKSLPNCLRFSADIKFDKQVSLLKTIKRLNICSIVYFVVPHAYLYSSNDVVVNCQLSFCYHFIINFFLLDYLKLFP